MKVQPQPPPRRGQGGTLRPGSTQDLASPSLRQSLQSQSVHDAGAPTLLGAGGRRCPQAPPARSLGDRRSGAQVAARHRWWCVTVAPSGGSSPGRGSPPAPSGQPRPAVSARAEPDSGQAGRGRPASLGPRGPHGRRVRRRPPAPPSVSRAWRPPSVSRGRLSTRPLRCRLHSPSWIRPLPSGVSSRPPGRSAPPGHWQILSRRWRRKATALPLLPAAIGQEAINQPWGISPVRTATLQPLPPPQSAAALAHASRRAAAIPADPQDSAPVAGSAKTRSRIPTRCAGTPPAGRPQTSVQFLNSGPRYFGSWGAPPGRRMPTCRRPLVSDCCPAARVRVSNPSVARHRRPPGLADGPPPRSQVSPGGMRGGRYNGVAPLKRWSGVASRGWSGGSGLSGQPGRGIPAVRFATHHRGGNLVQCPVFKGDRGPS